MGWPYHRQISVTLGEGGGQKTNLPMATNQTDSTKRETERVMNEGDAVLDGTSLLRYQVSFKKWFPTLWAEFSSLFFY